jgi:GDP-L-fucose synthase
LGLAWKTFIAPNLFGPHDHFDSEGSHLVAAVISKVKAAMETGERYVEMWGDGTPRREFLFTPDLALWIVNSLNNLSDYPEIMNIGYGEDFSIRDFYEMIIRMFNRNLQIRSNPSMPSGNRQKLMDSSLAISYGWNPNTPIELGIEKTISWYKENAQ